MLLFLAALGVFLSLILICYNAKSYKSTIYLGIFFLGLSIYNYYVYIILFSKSVSLVSFFLLIASVLGTIIYLAGPALFWYVRSTLADNHRLKKQDLLHLLPASIFFIAGIPHLFTPYSEKKNAAAAIISNPVAVENYRATELSEIVLPTLIFLSRPILILCYTIGSAIIFINYLKKKKKNHVLSGQHFLPGWIAALLVLTLMLAVSHTLLLFFDFTYANHTLFFRFNVLHLLSGAGLTGLLVTPFFFPNILYGLPRMPKSVPATDLKANQKNQLQNQKINHNHKFESVYLKIIEEKTDSCMKEHHPYLDPDCNLGHFAKLLDLPAHHLAYYFRETKKQHFNDYRNEWRVNHAKMLIMEGKIKKTTLENIAQQSGFSNRNSFLAAFKKFEGTSPQVFAIRLRRNFQS